MHLLMKTMAECRTVYPNDTLCAVAWKGIEFVCRDPSPDAYDSALAGQLALKANKDARAFIDSLEELTKSCVVSHTPEELDAIRKRGVRYLDVFFDVGTTIWKRLNAEDADKGKESGSDSTASSSTPEDSGAR